ncbi:MAG: hypothetical protein SGJ01_09810 [Gemmatimonadota bacterium]|nr:hypothetical protein [Gemmatimonadota bacterium]
MTRPLSLLAVSAAPEPVSAPEPVADPALFGAALLAAMQPVIQTGTPSPLTLTALLEPPTPEVGENPAAVEEGPGTALPVTKRARADLPLTATQVDSVTPDTLGELLAPAVRVARRVHDQPVALTRVRQVDQTTASTRARSLAQIPSRQGNDAALSATQPPATVQLLSPRAVAATDVVPSDSVIAQPSFAVETPPLDQGGNDDAAETTDRQALSRGNDTLLVALPVSQPGVSGPRPALPAAPSVTADAGAAEPAGEPPLAEPVGMAPGQVVAVKERQPTVPSSSAPAPRRPDGNNAARIQAEAPAGREIRQPAVSSSGKPTAADDVVAPGTHKPRRERLTEPIAHPVPARPDVMPPHDTRLMLPDAEPRVEPRAPQRDDESLVKPSAGTETPSPDQAAVLSSAMIAAGGMPHRAVSAATPVAQSDRGDTPTPRMIQDEPAGESAEGHPAMRMMVDARQADPTVAGPRGSLASAFAHALADLLSEGEIADVRVVRGRPETGGDMKEPAAAPAGRSPLPPAIAGVTTAESRPGPTVGSDQVPPAGTEPPKGRGTRSTQLSVADAEGDTVVLAPGAPLRRTPLATVTPSRVAPLPPTFPEAAWARNEPQAAPVERKLPSDRQELPPDRQTSANDAATRKREPVATGDTPSDTHTSSSSSLGGQTEPGGEPATRQHAASPGEARNLPGRDRNRDVPAGLADRVTLQLTDADGRPTRIRVAVLGDQVRAVILPPDNETGRQLERRMDDLHAALVRQGFVDPRVSVQQSVASEAAAGWVPPGRTDVPVPRGAEQPAGDQRQGSGRREQQQQGEEQRHPQGRSRHRDPEPRERESDT